MSGDCRCIGYFGMVSGSRRIFFGFSQRLARWDVSRYVSVSARGEAGSGERADLSFTVVIMS